MTIRFIYDDCLGSIWKLNFFSNMVVIGSLPAYNLSSLEFLPRFRISYTVVRVVGSFRQLLFIALQVCHAVLLGISY